MRTLSNTNKNYKAKNIENFIKKLNLIWGKKALSLEGKMLKKKPKYFADCILKNCSFEHPVQYIKSLHRTQACSMCAS